MDSTANNKPNRELYLDKQRQHAQHANINTAQATMRTAIAADKADKASTQWHRIQRNRILRVMWFNELLENFYYFFTHSFVHSPMALQPFIVPWSLLQFHNLFYTVGRNPWTGDQPVARPVPTHRINAHANIHVFEWDLSPRSQLSSERRQSMP
jgi:hypothetical protein